MSAVSVRRFVFCWSGSLSVSLCSPLFPFVCIHVTTLWSVCVFPLLFCLVYCLFVCLCIPVYPFVCLIIHLSVFVFSSLCVWQDLLSVCLSVWVFFFIVLHVNLQLIYSSGFLAVSICWSVEPFNFCTVCFSVPWLFANHSVDPSLILFFDLSHSPSFSRSLSLPICW